jgi:sphingosine kinase
VRTGKPLTRKIYVLVNPFGGKRKALEIIETRVRKIFEAASVELELEVTKHAGHAAEIAATFDFSQFDAFATCSGDGLMFEALQGFMSRADWRSANTHWLCSHSEIAGRC